MIKKTFIVSFIVSFILMASSITALTYTLDTNEFGNAQGYLGEHSFYDMTQNDETAICIPFKASITGTIESFYFLHNSTSGTNSSWCIDTTRKHPRDDSCLASGFNESGFLGYPFDIGSVSVTEDTTYYFCYEQHNDAGGKVTVESVLVDDTYGGDYKPYYNTISPYNNQSRQIESVTNPNMYVDYKSGGIWQGWSQSDYQVSGVAYCYGNATECFVLSTQYIDVIPTSLSGTRSCSFSASSVAYARTGVRFTYPFEDNTINKLKLMLVRGITTTDDKRFYIRIRNGTSRGVIYESPMINSSVLETSSDTWHYNNFTLYSHTLTSDITLKQNQYYFIGVEMAQTYGGSQTGNSICWASVNYSNQTFIDFIPDYQGSYIATAPATWFESETEPFFVIEFDNEIQYSTFEEEPTYQCNDGIDNDLDGFTDYPDDPSCTGITDNNEFPKDNSSQEEDDCIVSLGCVIYDSIPYSDSPFLHGWYGGQESDAKTVGFLGGYSIDLDTVDEFDIKENVIIFKNNQNSNNYNTLEGEFVLSILEVSGGDPVIDEAIYIGFFDQTDNGLAWVRLNVTAYSPEDYILGMYAYDGGGWTFVDNLYVDNSDNGFVRITFNIDEDNDEYQLSWDDFDGQHSSSQTFDYDSSGSGQIAKAMVTNTLDRADTKVLLNLVSLTGTDSSELETFCTTWDLPYHLKENFNGYMSECDWNIDPDIFFYGKLSMENEIDDFMLYKIFDDTQDNAIYYDRSRYATIKFDYKPYDDSESVNNMNLYIYDLAFTTAYIRLFFKINGNVDATVGGDNYNVYSSLTMNTSKEVMIVVDLRQDTFDFYYDGVLRDSNIGFYNDFYNAEYLNGIYFQSGDSHYEIDNLEVYESDEEGGELPNVNIPVIIPDADKSWCELFNKIDQTCSIDDDCETGECLVNGKCSKFDFTYCDENGLTRGNKCVLAGMGSCVLTSTGDLILDNFFLFLIFLVMLMGLVYLTIMLKN